MTSSISGLSVAEEDDVGVSIAGAVDSASLSDSMLALAPLSAGSTGIFDGVAGEEGEEGMGSRGRLVRRLMVTRLEVGSAGGCSEGARVGVDGAGGSGSASALMLAASPRKDEADGICESSREDPTGTVSTDRLREPPRDVRWRLRDVWSVVSSKGFGRPEQGSEEIARSRGASSIWQERAIMNSRVVEGSK